MPFDGRVPSDNGRRRLKVFSVKEYLKSNLGVLPVVEYVLIQNFPNFGIKTFESKVRNKDQTRICLIFINQANGSRSAD